ncbi:PTS cellobiose transporter subunit IIC [Enterococcus raffinosus]|uniref:Permease IIC component n=1 Tax=Enterococcus raffinosus TaxID=71452 RepID=A0AAW8TBE7_9ENTE|nr:PTS cellobiose transporter subunit IIC [Enterococcus raffinosus]MDT2524183.1 PTS cellobiose transporter subunit IIC [Enterococcus raffinosus]MDT2531636.1 PTS cellobiose transporter subunit IIC [Enterococcus raffinosus]MDT2535078.1 PTS cellobiose transporter subunit IIC [Enterococcus raffinosus]MDT2545099.1 PTS cellobiose transporter subunit IIC [Enterococcus raffinosus]MDT2554801.1 PTS cellobiose transporter subunit IIC [Enterococcus raffinosus]
MNGFMDKLAEKIMPLANKLGQNRYLTVLRDAFMLSFPLTMFGSIVVVINNLPFFNDATKGMLSELFGNGQNATMSIMSVFVTFGIGYYLSESYEVEGIFGGAVSFASFLILTPFVMSLENGEEIGGVLSLDRLGAKGMFIGMIAAFIAAEIYCRITKRGWQIKMPDGVPPAVTKSFAALIPAVMTLTVFLIVNAIMTGVFHANLHDVIYEVIQKPLTGLGSSLPATLLALFLVQFLWFFGLHGQIIVNSVMDPIWNTLMLDNLEAYKAGDPLPHIISKPFMETFTVGLGGSGMTLAVVILMAFVLKKKQYRDVGRLALAPGIFNVNEPAIFGLPIVLNATILIPWVLAPLVVTTVNYLVMAAGIVPPPTGVSVPWTVPIVASGILATNSWLGGALQVLDFIIVGFIWYPFLRILDKQPNFDIE